MAADPSAYAKAQRDILLNHSSLDNAGREVIDTTLKQIKGQGRYRKETVRAAAHLCA